MGAKAAIKSGVETGAPRIGRNMRFLRISSLAISILTASVAGAWAQSKAPEPDLNRPDESAPQASVMTYGNWSMSCKQLKTNDQQVTKRYCEVTQTITDQKGQALLLIAIGINDAGKRLVIVQTPVTVMVGTPLAFVLDDPAKATVIPFKYCKVGGCFAETELTDAGLSAIRGKSDGRAELDITDPRQKTIRVAVSLSGFDPAWHAYLKETHQKDAAR